MSKDAIVVVDGGIKESGELTKISLERVEKAVEAYKSGVAKRIIMSGGARGPVTQSPALKTEAQAMKEKAVELGIPANDILIEEKAKDVLGNAFFSKTIHLEPSRWKNVAVVTSDYHVPRAEYVFKKILGPDYMIEFVPADHELSIDEVERLKIEEGRKFDLARQWLESIKDGDTEAVEDFILNWHPAYTERKRISGTQLGDRAKDY